MYIPELRRSLISAETFDILGFEHSGGHEKTRFYKHGKLQHDYCNIFESDKYFPYLLFAYMSLNYILMNT